MMTPLTDYYEVLNCHPSDSLDDIKRSYQSLILKHHPDKQCAAGDVARFHQIDEAWKMLRDPEQRKRYDAELQQHKFNDEPIVHAKVRRSEFAYDTVSQCYVYPCRCGGTFVLPDDCIEPTHCDNSIRKETHGSSSAGRTANDDPFMEDEIYIECDECSFVIQLLSNQTNSP